MTSSPSNPGPAPLPNYVPPLAFFIGRPTPAAEEANAKSLIAAPAGAAARAWLHFGERSRPADRATAMHGGGGGGRGRSATMPAWMTQDPAAADPSAGGSKRPAPEDGPESGAAKVARWDCGLWGADISDDLVVRFEQGAAPLTLVPPPSQLHRQAGRRQFVHRRRRRRRPAARRGEQPHWDAGLLPHTPPPTTTTTRPTGL